MNGKLRSGKHKFGGGGAKNLVMEKSVCSAHHKSRLDIFYILKLALSFGHTIQNKHTSLTMSNRTISILFTWTSLCANNFDLTPKHITFDFSYFEYKHILSLIKTFNIAIILHIMTRHYIQNLGFFFQTPKLKISTT